MSNAAYRHTSRLQRKFLFASAFKRKFVRLGTGERTKGITHSLSFSLQILQNQKRKKPWDYQWDHQWDHAVIHHRRTHAAHPNGHHHDTGWRSSKLECRSAWSKAGGATLVRLFCVCMCWHATVARVHTENVHPHSDLSLALSLSLHDLCMSMMHELSSHSSIKTKFLFIFSIRSLLLSLLVRRIHELDFSWRHKERSETSGLPFFWRTQLSLFPTSHSGGWLGTPSMEIWAVNLSSKHMAMCGFRSVHGVYRRPARCFTPPVVSATRQSRCWRFAWSWLVASIGTVWNIFQFTGWFP